MVRPPRLETGVIVGHTDGMGPHENDVTSYVGYLRRTSPGVHCSAQRYLGRTGGRIASGVHDEPERLTGEPAGDVAFVIGLKLAVRIRDDRTDGDGAAALDGRDRGG